MSAFLLQRRIGALPWLSVSGTRRECFRALGEHAAVPIWSIMEGLTQLQALRRHVATPVGRARLDAVTQATAARFPVHMDEMAALAEGAGVDARTVLLLNMRGDFGDPRAGGCSDVAVPGDRWVLGHNEDGDPLFADCISGLTLAVDGERPVFALWYPGMLPANAFTLNRGLAWGVDHVPAAAATVGPARHVVARALQQVEDLDAAAELLAAEPSAGGFAYNFAERATGRIATIEAGGGATGRADAPRAGPMLWHTNHLRYSGAGGGGAGPSSCARGEVLARTAAAAAEPLGAEEVLDLLTTPLPGGVHAEAGAGTGGATVTLCTVVIDGASDEATFVPMGGQPARVPVADLLA